MKYAADEEGNFAGQGGYGYVSFEKFINGVQALKDGRKTLEDLDKMGLPTLKNTIATGAILEAGRRSLDEKNSELLTGSSALHTCSWRLFVPLMTVKPLPSHSQIRPSRLDN